MVRNDVSGGASHALAIAALSLSITSCGVTTRVDPAAAIGAEPAWVQVWGDEFERGIIDPAKWGHEVDCIGGGNDEAQCYTRRRENSFVDTDGILHIVAREEKYSAAVYWNGFPQYHLDDTSAAFKPDNTLVTRPYTSARLRTKNRFDFKYGRVLVRAKLPAGQGSWPALWMLPTDWVYGSWPASGEIDIAEAFNLDTPGALNQVFGTLHYGLGWPQWSANGAPHEVAGSLTQDFHTYMIEWEADEIRWFVDGIHYQTQNSAGWYNYIWSGQQTGFAVANPRAPFDQKFHLLLNLAIGGHAAGPPDTGWDADRELLVDYVRVYQCDAGNPDGSGCADHADAPVNAALEPTPDAGVPRVQRFAIFADGPSTLAFDTPYGKIHNALSIESLSQQAGNVIADLVDIGGAYGQVVDVTFTGAGTFSLSSADLRDVAGIAPGFALQGGPAWTNYGTLEFDLYVESIDSGTTLMVRLGNRFPHFGQFALETPAPGAWTHVVIRIADLLANPLAIGNGIDLARVINPMSIAATGTSTARIRVDNVALSCAVNEFSQPWQPPPTCSISAVLANTTVTGQAGSATAAAASE